MRVKIVKWTDAPETPNWDIGVTCDHCGADLILPTKPGTRILASVGMGLIFDTTPQPDFATPDSVKCPACRHTFDRDKDPMVTTQNALMGGRK